MDKPKPGEIAVVTSVGGQDEQLHAAKIRPGDLGVVVRASAGTLGLWFPRGHNPRNNDLNGTWNPHFYGFQRWDGPVPNELKPRAVAELLTNATGAET